MKNRYDDFIRGKVTVAEVSGFDVAREALPGCLLEHQRDAVVWALRGGCRAIFAQFGLGKTLMQLSIMEQMARRFPEGKCLIVMPLGVKGEFVRDGKRLLGMDLEYVRTDAEVEGAAGRILLTNYERVRDGDIRPEQFVAVSLDEASILRGYGTKTFQEFLRLCRGFGCERVFEAGAHYTAVNRDCVEEVCEMPADSVDLIVSSIPFSNHYEYSANYNDFGHNTDNAAFFKQMDFLTPELLRVLKPGRVACIHVKDRILFGNVTGYGMPTLDPFHMETTAHYLRHGFKFFGMITIETDVVRENNQTYRLGWTEQCKDGSKMGVGCPEYLLLFRKLPTDTSKGYADLPVKKSKAEYTRGRWQIDARAKWNSSGNRLLAPEEVDALELDAANAAFRERAKGEVYDYAGHVAVAEQMERRGRLPATFETFRIPARSPWVWDDVVRMRTLNCDQARKNLEKHICPLQFDIVERAIERWSNPGEVVLDPFGGIMTVPFCAVKLRRHGIGIELNADYFRSGLGYLRAAEWELDAPTLFDMVNLEPAELEPEGAGA